MIIPIDIPDDSPELEELQFVVDGINAERAKNEAANGRPAPVPMTIAEYVLPIVLGHFKQRVQQHYLRYAKSKSNTDLQNALGKLDKIRNQK